MTRLFWSTILVLLTSSTALKSQIAIGKTSVRGSGLIDFQNNTTMGIILPHVNDIAVMDNTSPGTFVYDKTSAVIKIYNGTSWINLTNPSSIPISNSFLKENGNANGASIGQQLSSGAKGVLVLDSTDKALILPHIINPASNVKSPYAGMMCYDPTSQLICLYNGENWFFWGITT